MKKYLLLFTSFSYLILLVGQSFSSVFISKFSIANKSATCEISSKANTDSDFTFYAEINETDEDLKEFTISNLYDSEFRFPYQVILRINELLPSLIKGRPSKTFLNIRVIRI